MAAEQSPLSEDVAELQAKVLEAISLSRSTGQLDRESLRKIALGEAQQKAIRLEPKPVRLSIAKVDMKDKQEKATPSTDRPLTTEAPFRQKRNSNLSLLDSSSSSSSPEQASEPPRLRDSVYFKRSQDYEVYLIEQWHERGLFPELFEKLKVLFISRKDVHALVKLCQSLPDMIQSPCQVELERAEAFRQFGDLDQAVLALNKAHDKDPFNEIALKSLGFCHKQRMEYDLALHWFKKWLDINPESVEAHYQCAIIYSRVKADDLARAHCFKALDLDGAHPMARALKEKLI